MNSIMNVCNFGMPPESNHHLERFRSIPGGQGILLNNYELSFSFIFNALIPLDIV